MKGLFANHANCCANDSMGRDDSSLTSPDEHSWELPRDAQARRTRSGVPFTKYSSRLVENGEVSAHGESFAPLFA